jgi:hypothetical protein
MLNTQGREGQTNTAELQNNPNDANSQKLLSCYENHLLIILAASVACQKSGIIHVPCTGTGVPRVSSLRFFRQEKVK